MAPITIDTLAQAYALKRRKPPRYQGLPNKGPLSHPLPWRQTGRPTFARGPSGWNPRHGWK